MSIRHKMYIRISHATDLNYPFYIEDPIDSSCNPGYTVLFNSKEYETILYEFQKAYQAISTESLQFFDLQKQE